MGVIRQIVCAILMSTCMSNTTCFIAHVAERFVIGRECLFSQCVQHSATDKTVLFQAAWRTIPVHLLGTQNRPMIDFYCMEESWFRIAVCRDSFRSNQTDRVKCQISPIRKYERFANMRCKWMRFQCMMWRVFVLSFDSVPRWHYTREPDVCNFWICTQHTIIISDCERACYAKVSRRDAGWHDCHHPTNRKHQPHKRIEQ